MTEEHRNWNPNAYLMQLVQKNPTITARNGNKAPAEDIEITQSYVILGTIADTMLRQMEGALNSVKGEAAINSFWRNSATIASTSINYEKLKVCYIILLMAEETVDEGLSGSRKKPRVRGTQLFETNRVERQEDEGEAQDIPNNSSEEDDENDVGDIWKS
ncbi:uncharacterized protein EV154DRAFT_588833, partial [Mucor mucedo]|uniref:uncharacterized protein n=1 Tax=Mucor mucedo TaxID=29922 RepID=UPI00221E9871